MAAKLVAYSQLPQEDGQDSLQQIVTDCARVSNPANQGSETDSGRLMKYLIDNKHWSPLEMVSICLEVNTTRDIARQMLRHRSFSFQEFSQRYADPVKELDFVTREARLQDTDNRQNSIELTEDDDRHVQWKVKQLAVLQAAKSAYKWAISNGIAKEQARAVLPEGLTMSRMYVNGTLRSWVHYIELRTGNGTQKEHMQLANDCAREIEKVFPLQLTTRT
tara:strand:- start:599 stop:1258 length:660 start_codon:yes stop_codon:yes gene_type:complete